MILVFGGHGQLGRELTRLAQASSKPLTALDRATVDIADATSVAHAIDRVKPSVVVNAAAYTKVDLAETEPDAAHLGNAVAPGIVAQACASVRLPLIHVSTDYVFDGAKPGPYIESDPIAPLGVYGHSKAAGESAVRDALSEHVIMRTAWVYGEFGNNFLKTMIRLTQQRDELRVVDDQRGCPTATLDLARAIMRVADRLGAANPPFGTYHFAGAGITTWYGLAQRIVQRQAPITGRRPTVTPIGTADYPTPARRPANSAFDCSLFAETFGFQARPWADAADEATLAVVHTLQQSEAIHGA